MANVGSRGHNTTSMTQIHQSKAQSAKFLGTSASRDHEHSTSTAMTSRFEARKRTILRQLDAPDGEYHDLSPKGSIDAPIRDLISEINGFDGLVTTSSCSGRISVFLEGLKADSDALNPPAEGEESRAGPGGKGGGGIWLFISHDPVEVPNTASSDFTSKFGLVKATADATRAPGVHCRFVHLKFEPMVSMRLEVHRRL